jgi:predicted PurR-regulated permease PerM
MANPKKIYPLLLWLSAALLAVWLLWKVVIYFLIALIVAGILRTPTNYLNSTHFFGKKIPRIVAVFSSFSMLIGIFVLFIYLFVPLITAQIEVISSLNISSFLAHIQNSFLAKFEKFFNNSLLVSEQSGFIVEKIKSNLAEFGEHLKVTELINQAFSLTSSVFAMVFAVGFISFFLLYEQGMIRRKIISLIPNQYFEVSITTLYKVEKLLSNYLLGLLLQMLFVFAFVSVGLLIAGVNYAVTIAIFAALVNIVPIAGPLTYVIFGMAVGLTTSNYEAGNLGFEAVKIMIVFGVTILADSMIIQPTIFSKSIKAHPLEIFAVIFSGAALAGPLGMIAAIPAYTVIRVCVAEFSNGYKQYKIFKLR